MFSDEPLRIGKHEFRSRLIVGTGKYPSMDVMQRERIVCRASSTLPQLPAA